MRGPGALSRITRLGLIATVVVFAVGSVRAALAPSAPSFAPEKRYRTGDGPQSLALADLNGDGVLDLATANAFDQTVSVFLNRGDGSFRGKRDYGGIFTDAPELKIGDLNADRRPDLVVAGPSGHDPDVSVLLNSGDGTFQPALQYTIGLTAASVAIGDLNGDGLQDLATVDPDIYQTVSVALNEGNGSFQPAVEYRTGLEPTSVVSADLNGDGLLDLTTANNAQGANTVSVLLNRGDGTFSPKLDYRAAGRPYALAVADLNHDGKIDLVTQNTGEDSFPVSVSVLLNDGHGRFRTRRQYPANGYGPVAVGDLNGDGWPDLAVGNDEDSLSLLLNRGDGTFATGLRTQPTDTEELAIGDLNGDHKPDLAAAILVDPGNAVAVRLNTTGLCTVPNVKAKSLAAARRAITKNNCRLGATHRRYARTVQQGRVISQKPRPATVLRTGGRVDLVLSRGPRHPRYQ